MLKKSMVKKSNVSRLFLAFVKITGYVPVMLFLKPKKHYVNKNAFKGGLPKPCILMSNHTSLMDFVLYLMSFPFCTLRFWMAEVLFNKGRLFSWFLFKIGGIYINRDTCDFGFVEDSLEVLDKNGRIGVFPQGRLPVNGCRFPFKPGIIAVALRTDAPIVPVYTDGNYGITKRAHFIIGEPIYLREYCDNENPTKEQRQKLLELLEEKTFELKDVLEARKSKK